MADSDKIGHPKKAKMLKALEDSLGIVTIAAKSAGISRNTHYRWMEEDPDYREAVEELNNVVLDFAEASLHEQIREKSTAATIFLLKTRGKGRGYVERQELDLGNFDGFTEEQLDEYIKKETEALISKGNSEEEAT